LLELPVTIRHGDRAAQLPLFHRDPFDRMLVAQALEEGLVLVTADGELAQYGVPILVV
jgi:PIN domain nuclease of toxin-antitoxin system